MNDPTTYEQLTEKIKLLHPFIQPKDVSIYNDQVYPADPHPKIATIASLMNELYTLFINMQYIPASSVSFAPHTTNPISLRHAALFGLEKQVVDLLQMLPYHDGSQPDWNFGSDNGEFLFGGEFDDDLRGEEEGIEAVWWRKCVDPLFYLDVDWKGKRAVGWDLRCEDVDDEGEEMGEECEEEEEEEKEGWLMTYNHEDDNEEDKDEDWDDDMTDEDESSSEVSEDDAIESEELLALHQETIEAEAAEQKEAALQAQAEEAERLKRHTLDNDPRDERLLLYLRPWHVTLNKLGNHGTILFLNTHTFTISQTDQEFGNLCDFKHNAIPYLQNVINKFKTLDWIPGGLYSPIHGDEYAAYKNLYTTSGWPNAFDPSKFHALRKQFEKDQRQRYHDQEPLRKFCDHVGTMQSRELSKLHYNNAVQKLSTLPQSPTHIKEKEELQRIKEQCGKEFLPEHYKPISVDILTSYLKSLQQQREQGRSEDGIKGLKTLIAETKQGMTAKGFEERDWIIYNMRRKQALEVEEEVKEGFDWTSAWRGVSVDLDVVLTQEGLEKMARERFREYHG
ncbi:hypothetical protein D6D12_09378 [Aureobasidium pullulans]|uniref:Knr4/Smi1-like domain-containing protein n=1 Tax=Aureobasidium pullulans TaxID=5580 RepID=A0AB74JHP9_AURPU|nr:hypothetical protein D6D12_09378 [Aureobasidium pullulans]